MPLDVTLRQQHKTERLRPFGNDVSDDLSPFPSGIHFREQHHPADSSEQQKNAERMIAQKLLWARRQCCIRRRLLCRESLSYIYFVARTMSTTPDQSAIAFPKNEPMCVLGFEKQYKTNHRIRMLLEAMVSEWS
jgi:hypothetical protein